MLFFNQDQTSFMLQKRFNRFIKTLLRSSFFLNAEVRIQPISDLDPRVENTD